MRVPQREQALRAEMGLPSFQCVCLVSRVFVVYSFSPPSPSRTGKRGWVKQGGNGVSGIGGGVTALLLQSFPNPGNRLLACFWNVSFLRHRISKSVCECVCVETSESVTKPFNLCRRPPPPSSILALLAGVHSLGACRDCSAFYSVTSSCVTNKVVLQVNK